MSYYCCSSIGAAMSRPGSEISAGGAEVTARGAETPWATPTLTIGLTVGCISNFLVSETCTKNRDVFCSVQFSGTSTRLLSACHHFYSRIFRRVEKKQRADGVNGLRQTAESFTLTARLSRHTRCLAATDYV